MNQQVPYIDRRNALQVTLSVWRALFLREVLGRLVTERAAWFWLLFDPLAHIVFAMVLFSTIKQRNVSGAEFVVFLVVGVMGFKQFTNTSSRSSGAVKSNKALLSYKQVKPVDTVLVKAAVEGLLIVVTTLILLTGASLFGFDVLPHDPLTLLLVYATLWLMGTGLGLILSAITPLAPEVGKVVGIIFTPLYFLSGVLYSLSAAPPYIRAILLYNPIVHGLELARAAFFAGYHAVVGISYAYLAWWAGSVFLLGLALQYSMSERLGAR